MDLIKTYLQKEKQIKKILTNPKNNLILLIIISLFFFSLFFSLKPTSLINLIKPIHLFSFLMLFILYYFLKALAFKEIFSHNTINVSFIYSLKSFFISDFVELISFTGKIGADATKYFLYKKQVNSKKLISIILSFRLISTISLIATIFLLINQLFFLVFIIALFFLFLYLNSKNNLTNFHLFFAFFLNFLCELIKISVLFLTAFIFKIPLTSFLALVFLISKIIGLISLLPFGFGVQDFSLSFYLKQFLSINELVSFNLLLRLVSVIPSAIIGWLIISFKLIKFKNKQ